MKPLAEYPKRVIKFVEEHYKEMSDTKLQKALLQQFPDCNIHPRASAYIRKKYGYIKSETKSIAFRKVHERRSPKIGAVAYNMYRGRKQWMVKIDQGQYRQYATYLWRKTYGKIPFEYRADWIDDQAPLTIDNLHLIKKDLDIMPIGSVTSWMHDGHLRELIKTARGKYELYTTYLWRKHYGSIPEGYFVRKIDSSAPVSIENIELTNCAHDMFSEGAKNLDDWYVKCQLQKMGFSKELIPESIIKIQRAKIELCREIKKRKNATNANRATLDNEVERTPSQND